MSYPMISAGALNAVYFGSYGLSLKAICKAKHGTADTIDFKPTNWDIFIGGCVGGAAQLTIACPVDLVKIKLQTQTGSGGAMTTPEVRYRGPMDVLHRLYKQEGLKGCYKGLPTMACRYVFLPT